MIKFKTGRCPVCQSKLHICRLSCPECDAEYRVNEELSPFEYLSEEQQAFLMTFLQCDGSIKAVEEKLGISYPTVKKRYEELMIALGIREEIKQETELEEIDMSIFGKLNRDSKKASEIVKNKLYDHGGRATITLQSGKPCSIAIASDGHCFMSNKLPGQTVDFSAFDIVTEFLKEKGGRAPKGLGRQDKVGEGKCGPETVMYQLAKKYYNKVDGESTYDPIFVLAAVLEWAGIAENGYGYIRLYNYKG